MSPPKLPMDRSQLQTSDPATILDALGRVLDPWTQGVLQAMAAWGRVDVLEAALARWPGNGPGRPTYVLAMERAAEAGQIAVGALLLAQVGSEPDEWLASPFQRAVRAGHPAFARMLAQAISPQRARTLAGRWPHLADTTPLELHLLIEAHPAALGSALGAAGELRRADLIPFLGTPEQRQAEAVYQILDFHSADPNADDLDAFAACVLGDQPAAATDLIARLPECSLPRLQTQARQQRLAECPAIPSRSRPRA